MASSVTISLKLGYKVSPGRVTVGIYDGIQPSLTAATQGERVLLLPLKKALTLIPGRPPEPVSDDVTFLNINQTISCLCAGQMLSNSDRSFLFVGTQSNVFGYDVENNKDLFFKEVPDGVNVITIGSMSRVQTEEPIVIAGGNCSLQGFDNEGNDCFWTVTGDNVGSVALLDFDGDGENEMVVGSDDFDIRVFKGDDIIAETSETDAISCIAPMHGNVFAYALVNGTIGVYEKAQRLWRIKSKNHAVAICGFDFDGDGIPELVTGWSNGKLDIRNIKTGEVLFKDNFTQPLAGICTADINSDGKLYLICCDIDGEVRIYRPSGHDGRMLYISPNVEQEAIRELSMKKHHLLLELKNYDTSNVTKKGELVSTMTNVDRSRTFAIAGGAIPTKTQLQTAFSINMGSDDRQPTVDITLSTNNDTVLRAALIFAEGIFQGECHVVHPKEDQMQSSIVVPLSPPKNVVVDLHIKAYVSEGDSNHFHVFEMTRQLPRFAMYALCKEITYEPNSFVKLPIQERPSRIAMWMNQSFMLSEEAEYKGPFSASFLSLRNNLDVKIDVESSGETTFRTLDIDLAGDLVQSLCQYLSVTELETTADFPEEVSQLEMLLKAIEEYEEANERLGAEISDQSGIIKSLLIRAEDARLIDNIRGMRGWYRQLHDVNKTLVTQHQIRCTTNENVMESIKSVNQIVQKAARLRVGRAKAIVISACRDAVKTKNIEALARIIRSGAL